MVNGLGTTRSNINKKELRCLHHMSKTRVFFDKFEMHDDIAFNYLPL